jgi:hypothetical protein
MSRPGVSRPRGSAGAAVDAAPGVAAADLAHARVHKWQDGSRRALSVPEKLRTGQAPTTISQVSAYPPLTLRCPFLNRVSQVRILPGAPGLGLRKHGWGTVVHPSMASSVVRVETVCSPLELWQAATYRRDPTTPHAAALSKACLRPLSRSHPGRPATPLAGGCRHAAYGPASVVTHRTTTRDPSHRRILIRPHEVSRLAIMLGWVQRGGSRPRTRSTPG